MALGIGVEPVAKSKHYFQICSSLIPISSFVVLLLIDCDLLIGVLVGDISIPSLIFYFLFFLILPTPVQMQQQMLLQHLNNFGPPPQYKIIAKGIPRMINVVTTYDRF